jgi:hypothetical protein
MTPRFKWLHPLAEAITNKLTIKMDYKIVEKITQNPKP